MIAHLLSSSLEFDWSLTEHFLMGTKIFSHCLVRLCIIKCVISVTFLPKILGQFFYLQMLPYWYSCKKYHMIKIKNLNKSSMPVLNNIFKIILETPLMPGVEKQKHTMKKNKDKVRKRKNLPMKHQREKLKILDPLIK